MHVRVLETGKHHDARQLNDLGTGTDEAGWNAVTANVDNEAAAYRDGAGPTPHGIHGVHLAAAQDEISVARLAGAARADQELESNTP
ncbi:MAG TPA: hypothetical protein VNC19_02300 [Gemmatimonadales bacterium]|jgi:hypothetical protein|nr:hypothetical protein [Gemmatimonadales bacterium]